MKNLWIVGVCIFYGALSYASETLELKSVKASQDNRAQIVELHFNQDIQPDQFSIDYINETVQVNLPSVKFSKGTQTDRVNSDLVRTLYTYKVSDNLSRTRIILNTDALKYQGRTRLEAQGSVLKVLLNPSTPKVSEEDLRQAHEWVESATKESSKAGASKEASKEISKTPESIQVAQNVASEAPSQESLEGLEESEIPVLAKSEDHTNSKKQNPMTRILVSLGLVFGLLGAFFVYARKNFVKAPKNKNTQIKILTQHYIGPKKSLMIIRVAGESMLIGVTDNQINLIKPLALMDDEIPQETPKEFSSALNKLFKRNLNLDIQETDEFAISKIKDVVSGKLKGMKEI